MMAATHLGSSLLGRLPIVRGRYKANAELANITWFRVGGPAEVTFRPTDLADLIDFLRAKPSEIDITVIGVGSNVLIRDGGIDGVVIRLGRGFVGIQPDLSVATVRCGAAALDVNVAEVACQSGIAGLEFLTGVPGTIGGALRMNAGAFGCEINDVLVSADAVDLDGNYSCFAAKELNFSYRHCGLPWGWIFVAAELKGTHDDTARIRARLDAIKAEREASQPIRMRTGGSTFKNPTTSGNGPRAWELIDRAGCRGLTRGEAEVSDKHCNFLINCGSATAADLESLGEEVRRRVLTTTGIELEWEIQRVGRPLSDQVAAVDLRPVAEDT